MNRIERMLKAKSNRFGSIYTIFDNGIPTAELKTYEYPAVMLFQGNNYQFYASGSPYVGYDLKENDNIKATADDSVFDEYPGTVLEYNGIRYLIQQERINWQWIKSFIAFFHHVLTLGIFPRYDYSLRAPIIVTKNNTKIGSIRTNPKSWRETIIELPEKWPFYLKVFVFWIVKDNC